MTRVWNLQDDRECPEAVVVSDLSGVTHHMLNYDDLIADDGKETVFDRSDRRLGDFCRHLWKDHGFRFLTGTSLVWVLDKLIGGFHPKQAADDYVCVQMVSLSGLCQETW